MRDLQKFKKNVHYKKKKPKISNIFAPKKLIF